MTTDTNLQKDSNLRSILKAITWRLIATFTTFVLAYLIFQNSGCEDVLQKSSIVAGLELFIKLLLYYLHERAWLLVPRGTIRSLWRLKK